MNHEGIIGGEFLTHLNDEVVILGRDENFLLDVLNKDFLNELQTSLVISMDINGQTFVLPLADLDDHGFQDHQILGLGLICGSIVLTPIFGVDFGQKQTPHQLFIVDQLVQLVQIREEVLIGGSTFNRLLCLNLGIVLSQQSGELGDVCTVPLVRVFLVVDMLEENGVEMGITLVEVALLVNCGASGLFMVDLHDDGPKLVEGLDLLVIEAFLLKAVGLLLQDLLGEKAIHEGVVLDHSFKKTKVLKE